MLDSGVLVLNRLWQAVNVCSVRRSLSLLYQGHAQVVIKDGETFNTFGFEDWKDFSMRTEAEKDEEIRTVSFKLRVPRVILLLFYDRLFLIPAQHKYEEFQYNNRAQYKFFQAY